MMKPTIIKHIKGEISDICTSFSFSESLTSWNFSSLNNCVNSSSQTETEPKCLHTPADFGDAKEISTNVIATYTANALQEKAFHTTCNGKEVTMTFTNGYTPNSLEQVLTTSADEADQDPKEALKNVLFHLKKFMERGI